MAHNNWLPKYSMDASVLAEEMFCGELLTLENEKSDIEMYIAWIREHVEVWKQEEN